MFYTESTRVAAVAVYWMKMGRQAYAAELIGTFALVFFGSVSVTIFTVVLGFSAPASSLIGVAFAYGIILMVMVYAIGPISGCHVNPAITITAMAMRKLEVDDGVAYLVAQVVGATLAGWAHALVLQANGALARYGLPEPSLVIAQNQIVALVVELTITFFLMFSVYSVLYTNKVPAGASGLLIGMTLTVDVLIAGPLTGGAANPARALGPAIAAGEYASLWLYWVGPIIGALLAGLFYERLLIKRE